MWESLIVITLCYVAAQIMIRLGYRRAVIVPLSLACGLTITMLLAVLMANLRETTQWISLPGDWILSGSPILSLCLTLAIWAGLSALIIDWQRKRKSPRITTEQAVQENRT